MKKKGYNITLGIFIGLIAGVIVGMGKYRIERSCFHIYVGIKNDDFPTCIYKFSDGNHWHWGYCQNG